MVFLALRELREAWRSLRCAAAPPKAAFPKQIAIENTAGAITDVSGAGDAAAATADGEIIDDHPNHNSSTYHYWQ